jgi:hypothetical protein
MRTHLARRAAASAFAGLLLGLGLAGVAPAASVRSKRSDRGVAPRRFCHFRSAHRTALRAMGAVIACPLGTSETVRSGHRHRQALFRTKVASTNAGFVRARRVAVDWRIYWRAPAWERAITALQSQSHRERDRVHRPVRAGTATLALESKSGSCRLS